MSTSACPRCGTSLDGMDLHDQHCRNCGATLPDPVAAPPAPVGETPQPSEDIAPADLLPKYPHSPLALESDWLDAKIRRSDYGETLAVLALLLPVAAQGLALACHLDSLGINMALGWGTVAVTALVLAIDAAFLGTTDLHGKQRGSPVALFFGVLLLWIICYPVAFFRRRHFGRPNLGPLALLVAGFFIAVPFLHQFSRFGTLGGGLPTCTSREVTSMVEDLIRKGDIGSSVRSISDFREISYDPAGQTRNGQCLVRTQTETLTATFRVTMLNRSAGTFQVEVDPIIPQDPPSCTDRQVIALLEQIIREGPNGHRLKTVAGHEETRYDRERKNRHGRCRVTMEGWAGDVAYKIYWVDQKTGRFQVEIEP